MKREWTIKKKKKKTNGGGDEKKNKNKKTPNPCFFLFSTVSQPTPFSRP
jgi:hypothetical protein